jgi:hypothetical protein
MPSWTTCCSKQLNCNAEDTEDAERGNSQGAMTRDFFPLHLLRVLRVKIFLRLQSYELKSQPIKQPAVAELQFRNH